MFLDLNALCWKKRKIFQYIFAAGWISSFSLSLLALPQSNSFALFFLVISLIDPFDLSALSPTFSCQWYDTDALEQMPFPMQYQNSLSDFQKLLLLRCFRVDRVYRAVTNYVTLTMSER